MQLRLFTKALFLSLRDFQDLYSSFTSNKGKDWIEVFRAVFYCRLGSQTSMFTLQDWGISLTLSCRGPSRQSVLYLHTWPCQDLHCAQLLLVVREVAPPGCWNPFFLPKKERKNRKKCCVKTHVYGDNDDDDVINANNSRASTVESGAGRADRACSRRCELRRAYCTAGACFIQALDLIFSRHENLIEPGTDLGLRSWTPSPLSLSLFLSHWTGGLRGNKLLLLLLLLQFAKLSCGCGSQGDCRKRTGWLTLTDALSCVCRLSFSQEQMWGGETAIVREAARNENLLPADWEHNNVRDIRDRTTIPTRNLLLSLEHFKWKP